MTHRRFKVGAHCFVLGYEDGTFYSEGEFIENKVLVIGRVVEEIIAKLEIAEIDIADNVIISIAFEEIKLGVSNE